jgi:solute carrier family 35 protein E1
MMHMGGLASNRALPALSTCKAVPHGMTRPSQAGKHPLKRYSLPDLRRLGHEIDAVEHNARSSTSRNATCRATAGVLAAESLEDSHKEGALFDTLKLGLLFGAWYTANIYFNIYNKHLLKVFPYPLTCTAIHFMVGSTIALLMWILRLHKKPQVEMSALKSVTPLACIHVVGNVLTNVSLRAVAVSFTHTVKALEPFFSVIMSFIFLGDVPTVPVAVSLVPIVTGVALASTSELSFNWTGFLAALGSNITFQSRNVLSKKFMLKGTP